MNINKAIFQVLVLCGILISITMCSKAQQLPQVSMETFPLLSIKNDSVDIELSAMQVGVKVMGNIALTSYDITFFNPSNRILEGELNFPLKANQQIVGFSMDIEGKMREGVVVEKEQGRRVFDAIVREGIDPGLLEKTSGNNFRARVFPLLAKANKRIIITCQEELPLSGSNYFYQLPMQFNKTIDQFSIRVEVIKGFKKPSIVQNDFTHLRFEKWEDAYVAEARNQKVYTDGLLTIELPYTEKKETVLSAQYGKEYFFYASLPNNVKSARKQQLETIHVLWDVSGSGGNRNIEKEKQVLKEYLKLVGATKVLLSTFNYELKNIGEFKVDDSNADELLMAISILKYDGGSRMDNLPFNSLEGQEIIIVTDGISNLGEVKIQSSKVPITVLNSSLKANHHWLNLLAESNGGSYVDLSVLDVDDAVNNLLELPVKVSYRVAEGSVDDVITRFLPRTDQVIVTGNVVSSNAKIVLEFIRGKELVDQHTIEIDSTPLHQDLPIARLWATHRINELMIDKERNKDLIVVLAKEYGVVTDYTSLMVLERVEDYARFSIEPPAELKEAYDELKRVQSESQTMQIKSSHDVIQNLIKDYKQWWNTDFPLTKQPSLPFSEGNFDNTPAIRDRAVTRQQENRPPPPPPSTTEVLNIVEDDVEMDSELAVEFEEEANDMPPLRGRRSNLTTFVNATPWDSTATYMSAIQDLNKNDVYSYYLGIKQQYPNQPSFYLDVASYLFEMKKREEAISVISNVAELQLENAEIMRIVGHKLLEKEQLELAVLVFERVLEMRSEDLQSYRDLAIAYEKNGDYQKALDLMVSTLEKQDLRGNYGFKGIILNEINSLINKHEELQIDALNEDWRFNMPVDVRIVLSWSTDNSDVDLWVTEPSGERCYYQHNRTWLGGRLSQDITSGYGPEEYMIKVGKAGSYKIQANYYGDTRATISGPITLRAEIFQNYGTPKQTSRQIVLQLKDKKQVIDLGEVVVE